MKQRSLVNDIPITKDDFEHISCIVEIPKGTNTKYEYNEEYNIFELERCLVSSLQYPVNYGFISQTFALDNDPLDVLIFNHDPIDRGSLVRCRVLGVLDFVDNEEIDYKIIAVPHWSPKSRYPRLDSIEQEHLKIFKQFFKIYKIDRKSSTKVGEWKNGKEANTIVSEAHKRWKKIQNEKTQHLYSWLTGI
jgi:inorganic pyrophosphatase